MSIEVNGVSLPDIPSEVLESYPYAVIRRIEDYNGNDFGYMLTVLDSPMLYATDGETEQITSFCNGYVEYFVWEDITMVEWAQYREVSNMCMYTENLDTETNKEYLVWSNHDILEVTAVDETTGEFTTGDAWFPSSLSDPNYYAPKSWFDGMARQVMRLTGTSDKLTTTAMLAALKALELTGGDSVFFVTEGETKTGTPGVTGHTAYLDKTMAEIQAAVDAGQMVVYKTTLEGAVIYAPLCTDAGGNAYLFSMGYTTGNGSAYNLTFQVVDGDEESGVAIGVTISVNWTVTTVTTA